MKRGSFFGRLSRATDLAAQEEAEARDDVVVMETPAPAQAAAPAPAQPVAQAPTTPVAEAAVAVAPVKTEVKADMEEDTPEMPEPEKEPMPEAPMEPETKEGEATETEDEWNAEVEGQLTIDVYQTSDAIVIKSTIAGVSADNLDISIDNDMVTIQGERSRQEEVAEKDYYYQECYWGSFSRSVILPCDVKADKADAELKNGILTIKLPKENSTKTRKIEVKMD